LPLTIRSSESSSAPVRLFSPSFQCQKSYPVLGSSLHLLAHILSSLFNLALIGQVYQTLVKEREDRKLNNVVICRVEQISPFPYDLLTPYIDQFPNADIVWAQEEPLNAGAWSYVQPRLFTAFKATKNHTDKTPVYAGRNPSSSPATGKKAIHLQEIKSFNEQAFAGLE
jgi:2-oxoglutarate dehydrogenase complex dehydrogenase (E1) component-like enzyme